LISRLPSAESKEKVAGSASPPPYVRENETCRTVPTWRWTRAPSTGSKAPRAPTRQDTVWMSSVTV